MSTTADDVLQALVTLATNDASKPSGLAVEPSPVLDLETVDLPYLGLTVTHAERPTEADDTSAHSPIRTCLIQAEIWAQGSDSNFLETTKAIRKWLLKLIFADDTLGDLVISTQFEGYAAAGGLHKVWVGVAVLDFTFTYYWRPL